MAKSKIPTKIGSTPVKQLGEPFVFDSGKLKGEKFVSLVAVDEDDHSRWEYRFSNSQVLHTIDRNGDII